LSGGFPAKVVLFFGGGKFGWTESQVMYLQSSNPDGPALAALDRFARDWIKARRGFLSASYVIEAARYEFIGGPNTGQSLLREGNDVNLGAGEDASLVAPVWLGWWAHENDASAQVRGSRVFRGLGQNSTSGWTPGVLLAGGVIPAGLAGGIKAMNVLLGTTYVSGGTSATPCMATYSRVLFNANVKPITNITLNGSGQLVVQMPPSFTPVPSPGDKLKITAKRQRCIRGLAGVTSVVAFNVGPAPVITISKKFCCNPADLAGFIGKAGPYVPAYVGYPAFVTENGTVSGTPALSLFKLAKKDTGRPFFGTRGRAASRCC
jgi:hypothetical protein